jgi:hypothetical protein
MEFIELSDSFFALLLIIFQEHSSNSSRGKTILKNRRQYKRARAQEGHNLVITIMSTKL